MLRVEASPRTIRPREKLSPFDRLQGCVMRILERSGYMLDEYSSINYRGELEQVPIAVSKSNPEEIADLPPYESLFKAVEARKLVSAIDWALTRHQLSQANQFQENFYPNTRRGRF